MTKSFKLPCPFSHKINEKFFIDRMSLTKQILKIFQMGDDEYIENLVSPVLNNSI